MDECMMTNKRISELNFDYVNVFTQHRKKLLYDLKILKPNSVILLKGAAGSQEGCKFEQEPNFYWLFGINEPDFYGAFDIKKETSYLFYPTLLHGCPTTKSALGQLKCKYGVDFVYSYRRMGGKLAELGHRNLILLNTRTKKQQPIFPEIECFEVDDCTLQPILYESRMIHTEGEIDLISHMTNVTCEGLTYVLKNAKPGMPGYMAESMFRLYIHYMSKLKFPAKIPTCTSIKNVIEKKKKSLATPNCDKIQEGEICYFEGGVSYEGYTVQIAFTFPINGVFSEKQRDVQEMVMGVRQYILNVVDKYMPPVFIEKKTEQALVNELRRRSLLTGFVDQMLSENIAKHFMTHDVFNLLNARRTDIYSKDDWQDLNIIIKPGMVVLLTYQCNFQQDLLNSDASKYLSSKAIDYLGCASTVQDIILIKENGYKILSRHPVAVVDIEGCEEKLNFHEISTSSEDTRT